METYITALPTTRHANADLSVRLEQMNTGWTTFENLQEEIEDKCLEIQLPEQEKERIDYENRFFAIKAALVAEIAGTSDSQPLSKPSNPNKETLIKKR